MSEKENVVGLAEARARLRPLSPDTIESIEKLLAEAKAGNVMAVGIAFAYREDGGTTRWQTLECDEGHHIYLLGLCHRLAHQAGIKSINASKDLSD